MIYLKVDTMPNFEYKNGESIKESLELFTIDNLLLPSQDDCVGAVFIQFVVEKDGVLTNIKILRGLDSCRGFNEESIRLVKSMPNWKPAILKERKVRAYMTIPIRFKLEGY